MLCARCATELIPGKRFCHACGAPAAQACASCGALLDPGFRFCPDCGTAVAPAASTAPAATPAGATEPAAAAEPTAQARTQAGEERLAQLSRHMPQSLAGRLVAAPGAAGGERKRVTVLFCDLAGSTEIADRLDPEEYRDLLEQYVELCIREIYRYEGIVNQLAGDGLMALFGAPVAHEDAPERAVRAALAIRAALVELNEELLAGRDFELKARFGINTGPVVVGTVGNDLKMDYTATGDTTNLASRLESLAAPNAILVSAASERLVRGRFEMRQLEPLQVKGKRGAITAYEVLGTIDEASAMSLAESRGLTRLVGRDEELAQLEACYRRLHGRLAQIVSVVGDAGSGKSRLIYEFKQRLARDLPIVLEARCSSLSQMLPYAPWASMLRHFFGLPVNDRCDDAHEVVRRRLAEIDPALEPLAPRLARMFAKPADAPSGQSAEETKRDTFDAVGELVVALSVKAPVVMIFEDLHWIDDPSREMLELGAAKLNRARVMMVVSHRPDYQPHWRVGAAFTQLHLRPLTDELATAMIRAVAGGELPSELEERVCAKAEGNPFFLEEMMRAMLEDGSLVRSGSRLRLTRPVADVVVPETVQEVVGARLDRLSPAAKRTAQVAAVLGRQFRPEQLSALLASEGVDVTAELEELEHRGIVHRKTMQAADEYRFGESVTQELAYESLLMKERRVLHGRIARLLEETPGEPSAERSALLAHHFSRSEDRGKAIEALLRAASDAERVPSYHAAREFYRAAWLAASAAIESAPDEAIAHQALVAAVGLCHMSIIYTSVGDMEEIERVAQRGRVLAHQLGVKTAYAAFPSYEGLAVMSGGGERFAHGLRLIEEALQIARRERLGVNAINISRGLAFAYLFDGRFRESREMLEESLAELEASEPADVHSDLWFGVRFMRETVLFQADEIDTAMAAARATHEHATRQGNRTVRTGTASLLAQAHFVRGEYADAVRWADHGLEYAREIGNIGACRPSAAVALAARVELGLPAFAQRYLRHLEGGLAGATNLPLYVRVATEALVSIGELKRAETVLEHGDRQSGGRFREALCASSRAELLRHDPRRLDDAERLAAHALELAEEVGSKATLAATWLTASQIALARGERERARAGLQRAREAARACGTRRYEQRADALLLDLAPDAVADQPVS